MSDERSRVLQDIRRALNRNGPVPDSVAHGLRARMESATPNLRPSYEGDLVERFVAKLQAVSGIVTRVSELADVAQVVEAHVERHDLPFSLLVAPDPELDDIPWSNRFSVQRRAAVGADRVSVTGCFAGIAETGTLALRSGAGSPTTLNFLPEDHIIVLRASRIVRYQEDVWARLRRDGGPLPRTVNLITGPSKTGDVEQIIQEGAHGPRRLHVVLITGT